MGDPSPRYARLAEPRQCCESALDAFTLAVPCGGCGVSVSDSGREPGFGAPRLPAPRFVRTAREGAPPASLATPRATARRHEYRGVSPVAAWPQESAQQPPRCSTGEPPSDSDMARRALAGRLPARHRDFRDSGTGLRLAAPTSASADYAACGSPVNCGTVPRRHETELSGWLDRVT